MSFLRKGTLRKAFAAAAMFTALTGVMAPQPAEAMPIAVHVAVMNAATTSANAAAAANARHNREAESAVIANPSAENIQHLQDRGLVDGTTTPYIQTVVAGMHVAPGTKADDVTQTQRDAFMQGLKDQRLVAEMSAPTAQQAVAKGMSQSLSPYFAQCRANVSSLTVSFGDAQKMQTCMENMHWEKDTKPALEKAALAGFIGLNVLGVAYVLNRQKKPKDPYSAYRY